MEYYGRKLNAYKANLHTHTTNSDGKFTPEEIIRRYAEAGYDVLAFTDHSTANPVSTYDGRGMTLISGMEMHPTGPRDIRWHLLALNTPEDFSYDLEKPAQEAVDAANAAGGMVFCAHPYWCGFTSAEIMTLKGLTGLEVYNASTRFIGKEFNMVHWDELLDAGYDYPAIAVDDIHSHYCFGFGWTYILAENKDLASIINALKNGDYYSSTGPEIKKLSIENNIFEAEFSPCTKVVIYSAKNRGGTPSRDAFLETQEMTSCRMDVSRFAPGYIRLQITDKDGKIAWSNPIRLDK